MWTFAQTDSRRRVFHRSQGIIPPRSRSLCESVIHKAMGRGRPATDILESSNTPRKSGETHRVKLALRGKHTRNLLLTVPSTDMSVQNMLFGQASCFDDSWRSPTTKTLTRHTYDGNLSVYRREHMGPFLTATELVMLTGMSLDQYIP